MSKKLYVGNISFQTTSDDLVAAFYRHLLSFPETQRLLRDPEVTKRLLTKQRQYLLSLAGPEIDAAYIETRRRIGEMHARVGLEPRWYLGAYALYHSLLTPMILASITSSCPLDRVEVATRAASSAGASSATTPWTRAGSARLPSRTGPAALIVIVPLPLTNGPPSLACAIMAIGLMEEDTATILAGAAFGVFATLLALSIMGGVWWVMAQALGFLFGGG